MICLRSRADFPCSNGIRFSITDVSPDTARILPIIYQDRAGISLYDAQWEAGQAIDIDPDTIARVIGHLKNFKRICLEYGVLTENIRIVATEATRTAKNSQQFQKAIKDATGIAIQMYPKEVEGLVGAYGVASSFETVRGLVMDLGGGSTQLTWIISPDDSKDRISMSEKYSVSLPYGAAALSRRLIEAERQGAKARNDLKLEILSNLKHAVEEIGIPQELKDKALEKSLNLYLSGGGFRGWGYLLMATHPIQPYPIPIINGFHVTADAFYDTQSITATVEGSQEKSKKIFRVSNRRASQVPAVAFLVSCLVEALPGINNVFFCQGGVREGTLFRDLEPQIRAIDPLLVACKRHAPPSAEALRDLLFQAIPLEVIRDSGPLVERPRNTGLDIDDVSAFAHCMYQHNHLPKDIRTAAALRSTTYGHFASTHGLSHFRRAALAIFLCERHGGISDLSDADKEFYSSLKQLLPELEVWWCLYLGRLASLLAVAYPSGIVDPNSQPLSIASTWESDARDPHESENSHGKKEGKKHQGSKREDDHDSGRDHAEKKSKKHKFSKDEEEDNGESEDTETKKHNMLVLKMSVAESENGFIWTEAVQDAIEELLKAGKKKSWEGKRKFRFRIEVDRSQS